MNFMAYNFPKLRKNIVNIGSNEILVKHNHCFIPRMILHGNYKIV